MSADETSVNDVEPVEVTKMAVLDPSVAEGLESACIVNCFKLKGDR